MCRLSAAKLQCMQILYGQSQEWREEHTEEALPSKSLHKESEYVDPLFCPCLSFDHHCSCFPAKQSAQPPAKYRAQRLSAASVGLKGEVKLEQSVIVNPPTMSGEHQEASAIPWTVNTESRHTAVVVVDDPDSHHKMQKIFPEKLAGNATECSAGKPKDTANASPKSHLGKKTVIMKAGRRSGGMRKPHSETPSRTLRRRSGRPDAGM